MLINSVIIVLREVLEAALIMSVLLAVTRLNQRSLHWVISALAAGLLGAWLYGSSMDFVSELFEGVGQELFNATGQFIAFAALVASVFLMVRETGKQAGSTVALTAAMIIAVTVLVVREGAEIYVYLSGFIGTENFLSGVGAGAILGAGIGFSIGALLFYFLVVQSARRMLPIATWLLAFMGAGMCAQATQLLIQADWIHVTKALWDSSSWLPESSLTGQLLYAMLGYEATPSLEEVVVYVSALMIMALAILAGYFAGFFVSEEPLA